MYQTLEELSESEELCNYCRTDPGWHSTGGGDPICCEGAYCEEAYESYLGELEVSQRTVDIAKKVKVTIERS